MKSHVKFTNPCAVDHMLRYYGLSVHDTVSFVPKKEIYSMEYYDSIRKEQTKQLAEQILKEGIAHAKQDRHAQAIECYQRALLADPTNSDTYVARGASYFKFNRFLEARKDFESALDRDPTHSNANKYLQTTLQKVSSSSLPPPPLLHNSPPLSSSPTLFPKLTFAPYLFL